MEENVAQPRPNARDRQRAERRRWHTFLTYWYGHLVSIIGDYLTLVALPLAAFALSNSAVVTASVEVVDVGATILFGAALGTLADRSDTRAVLVLTDLLRAGLLGLLAVLFAIDAATWPIVVGVSLLSAMLRALHDGAEGVLLARMIPDDLEVRAFARLESADSLGNLAGPTLGGSLAAIALAWSFGVDAFTFLFAMAMVLAISRDRTLWAKVAGGEHHEEDAFTLRFALQAIRRQARYVQWVGALTASSIAVAGFGALLIPFINRELGLGSTATGLIVACGGLGGLMAAPWLSRQHEVRLDHATWSLVLLCVTTILTGAIVSVVTTVIGVVSLGACLAVASVQGNSFRQQLFPSEMQGRVRLATRTVTLTANLIAILAGGVVSQYVGARWVFILFGGIALVAIVVIGLIRVETAPSVSPRSPNEANAADHLA